MTEANPRWLGDVPDEEDALLEQEMEAQRDSWSRELSTMGSIIALTDYEEWSTLDAILGREERNAIEAVLDPTIAENMEQVAAWRARVRVLRWARALPDSSRKERDNLIASLERDESRPDEDEVPDGEE